jgi:hypothetical protein
VGKAQSTINPRISAAFGPSLTLGLLQSNVAARGRPAQGQRKAYRTRYRMVLLPDILRHLYIGRCGDAGSGLYSGMGRPSIAPEMLTSLHWALW